MTEKDITRIAEATAKIVIDHIEAKQDQWNNEFEVNLEHFTSNSTMQPRIEQGLLNIEISELKLRLDKAIAAENYILASKINSKIIDLKTKLK